MQTEILWGKEFRGKEKRNLYKACTSPKSTILPKPYCAVQTVWRPKSLQNTNIKKPFQNKLLKGTHIVNRDALTQNQHLKLLAVPRQ